MKPTLKVTKDFTADFNRTIKKFQKDAVLVGIPEVDTTRKKNKNDQESSITNAALLAINHFGSEANNIPPRPVLAIGIRRAQNEIADKFKSAAIMALRKGFSALSIFYNQAGIIASNSVKKVINDQDGIPGPAESTLASRRARGFKGDKSLIVTGQLRNSITYVVKGEE